MEIPGEEPIPEGKDIFPEGEEEEKISSVEFEASFGTRPKRKAKKGSKEKTKKKKRVIKRHLKGFKTQEMRGSNMDLKFSSI